MSLPKVFIIGGTGAQGIPVVESLVKDGAYAVRILTRDKTSRPAKELLSLGPGITFLEGSFAIEAVLREGFTGSEIAFVNIDGFTPVRKESSTGELEAMWKYRVGVNGEKNEVKWINYGVHVPHDFKEFIGTDKPLTLFGVDPDEPRNV